MEGRPTFIHHSSFRIHHFSFILSILVDSSVLHLAAHRANETREASARGSVLCSCCGLGGRPLPTAPAPAPRPRPRRARAALPFAARALVVSFYCTTKSRPVAESELSSRPPVADVPTSICALAEVVVEVVPTTFVPATALILSTETRMTI